MADKTLINKIFGDLVNSLENGIGFFNPNLRVYSLKKEGNACKKIWEYICSKCDDEINNVENANKKIRTINSKTKTIFTEEEIQQLNIQGYTKI